MRVTVLLTASAGARDSTRSHELTSDVADACRRAGLDAAIDVVEGPDLAGAVRAAVASGSDVVAVGGGDGSVGTAAAVLAGGETPLGVLPLGTLNHFAKDLGIPLALDEAVRTIAEGRVQGVDVGEVNGAIFVNNSSIGLYPRVVEARDERRERSGWPKWPAMVAAGFAAVRRFRLLRVAVHTDGRVLRVKTPFVFIGNNEYTMSLFSMGTRSCLDAGRLSVYVARTSGRLGLARLVLHALTGRLDQAREFESLCVPELEILSTRPTLRVARDGEVGRMRPPLRYRVRPRALRVCVPAPPSP